jgi:HlyD family secretion protein
MKRPVSILLVIVFLGLVGGTFWFLWVKSQKKPVVFDVETPLVTDIVKKTVANGAIVPRQEVEIKPRVSGVIESLKVEPGQIIKRDTMIAKIQIVTNALSLAKTEADMRAGKIALDTTKRELDRNQTAFDRGILPEQELAKARSDWSLAAQTYASATQLVDIARNGEMRGASKQSNVNVTSTVDGMVIDVPVKLGFMVIEANTLNAGTTIAIVADMNDMIFDGNLDESEVGKIKEGMPLKIKIGALDEPVEGKLEYIAPKGKTVDGAIQFEIKAAITRKPGPFIRAGYSANADIVIAERKQVLAIREALVQFEDGKPFVEVETSPQTFVKKPVKVGVSDGINIEVLEGVGKDEKIKVPPNAGPASLPGQPASTASAQATKK